MLLKRQDLTLLNSLIKFLLIINLLIFSNFTEYSVINLTVYTLYNIAVFLYYKSFILITIYKEHKTQHYSFYAPRIGIEIRFIV